MTLVTSSGQGLYTSNVIHIHIYIYIYIYIYMCIYIYICHDNHYMHIMVVIIRACLRGMETCCILLPHAYILYVSVEGEGRTGKNVCSDEDAIRMESRVCVDKG